MNASPPAPPQPDAADHLPAHLSERVRVIQDVPVRARGEFVLYWMHHAVRSHENPALDTAIWIAEQKKLPLLVYQGLGGRHPYNSDRHHTFIMQGGREVQQDLQRMGIGYAFYLGRQRGAPTPLKSLAERAALVVTEDFPVPPFTNWTARLARQVDVAIWAVDCACVIPMQQLGRAYERAYAFRNETRREYEQRRTRVWHDAVYAGQMFDGNPGFDPIDLAGANIAELCAQCEIDHTIPPVAHTRGGTSAGYARWEKFKRHGLKSYARLRNDAAVDFPKGVSRLSAYLHHGHVSPFRIAREAALDGSKGADKFLDELLIWREMAHNFCFYHRHPGSLDVLPQWARQTLAEHADDPRKASYSWERLLRGRTGDALWDLAQQSLLVHGELHNNVRMTWGKAFLNWARHPQDALDMMIDLNHRFALDGNDASSYGGLLWCLGLFDRPFKPELEVIGALRPRSTRDHARRLDMKAYSAKVGAPAAGKPMKIAIIGAGISGLFAARTLSDQGHRVQVFEKKDRPGGRVATHASGSYAFDAGAQYFTTRDDRFERYVRSWQMDGIVRPWQGRVAVIEGGQSAGMKQSPKRWVGVPAMSAIPAHLASDLDMQQNVTVVSVNRDRGRWQLMDQARRRYAHYDAVVIAAPPPTAIELLTSSPKLANLIAGIRMEPCLAVMMAFEKTLDLPFDACFIHESALRWAARDNSKPGRPAAECWVLHATSGWSLERAGAPPGDSARLLIDEFFRRVGHQPLDPVCVDTRFWESAAAINPLNVGCLWDAADRIGVCGDWCRMSRLEGAALSGMAMAGRILATGASARAPEGIQTHVW